MMTDTNLELKLLQCEMAVCLNKGEKPIAAKPGIIGDSDSLEAIKAMFIVNQQLTRDNEIYKAISQEQSARAVTYKATCDKYMALSGALGFVLLLYIIYAAARVSGLKKALKGFQ